MLDSLSHKSSEWAPSEQAQVRALFPQLTSQVYLNSCSLGALATPVEQAIHDYLQTWARFGGRAWYVDGGWLEVIDSARVRFSTLIGARPNEIALAPNVSTALSALASAMDYHRRHRVITTALDFPTVAHQWLAKTPNGVACEVVESTDGISVPTDALERVVDEHTALVATSRIFFTSGAIQNVEAVAEIAHDKGALLLIDDYQATGQVPIDVRSANIDMLVSGSMKWMLGGPGLAFIYVREEILERLTPTIAGWFGHKRQLEFVVDTFEPRPNCQRFELGTHAIGSVYAANAGMALIEDIGVNAIRSRIKFLASDLIGRLRSHGIQLKVHESPQQRSGIVMVRCQNPENIVADLRSRSIIVDARPGFIRISVHFYNTIDDNRNVADELAYLFAKSQNEI